MTVFKTSIFVGLLFVTLHCLVELACEPAYRAVTFHKIINNFLTPSFPSFNARPPEKKPSICRNKDKHDSDTYQ
jgi:cyclophilin family peptidyl-prolyl cis-trans isomerase